METLLLRSWIEICPRVRERKELQLKYWEVEKTVVAVTTSPLSRARSGCSILRGPTWVELRTVRVAQLKKKKKKNNRDEKKEEEEKKISNRGRTSCPFSFFSGCWPPDEGNRTANSDSTWYLGRVRAVCVCFHHLRPSHAGPVLL